MSDMARPSVKFVYRYCNDLEAMRRFYAELLGLPHTSVENGKEGGFVEFDCGGFRMAFLKASAPLPVPAEFSNVPGCDYGSGENALCSVEYPREQYAAVVARLQAAGVPAMKELPDWSYPVLDPMGNTIELYAEFGDEVPAGAEDCAVSA